MDVIRVDLPELGHSAAKGEIVFASFLLRAALPQQSKYMSAMAEIPLKGRENQPTLARVALGDDPSPKVTRVIGPLRRKAC